MLPRSLTLERIVEFSTNLDTTFFFGMGTDSYKLEALKVFPSAMRSVLFAKRAAVLNEAAAADIDCCLVDE